MIKIILVCLKKRRWKLGQLVSNRDDEDDISLSQKEEIEIVTVSLKQKEEDSNSLPQKEEMEIVAACLSREDYNYIYLTGQILELNIFVEGNAVF
ncbi:hypothetical protein CDAR_384771 [Caerostris darwini]|uniref:Uncharacterized protein n=1 Tax=Caerostris darwini TaxID=1538125 RepID=A0AAV4WDJ6_9ARAC|nr:hypothetical protein CDAR_384771 [Caerostris darwini]